MNIKIDLVISASPELLAALQSFTGKGVVQTTVWKDQEAPVVTLTDNGEEKKGRKKKAEIETVKDVLQVAASEEVKTDLTQEMIIADAVPKSKAGHKDKIKSKVTELGYESITDLQPVHFDEFFAFLQTIPKP